MKTTQWSYHSLISSQVYNHFCRAKHANDTVSFAFAFACGHTFSMMSFHFFGVARHSLNEALSPQHSDGPGNDFFIFKNTAWSTASAWWPEQLQQERGLWGTKNTLG